MRIMIPECVSLVVGVCKILCVCSNWDNSLVKSFPFLWCVSTKAAIANLASLNWLSKKLDFSAVESVLALRPAQFHKTILSGTVMLDGQKKVRRYGARNVVEKREKGGTIINKYLTFPYLVHHSCYCPHHSHHYPHRCPHSPRQYTLPVVA